jgi:hypothetical protein
MPRNALPSGLFTLEVARTRKPISAKVMTKGDQRFVVLTYANGDVVKCKVRVDLKPARRPRRPQTRPNLSTPRLQSHPASSNEQESPNWAPHGHRHRRQDVARPNRGASEAVLSSISTSYKARVNYLRPDQAAALGTRWDIPGPIRAAPDYTTGTGPQAAGRRGWRDQSLPTRIGAL